LPTFAAFEVELSEVNTVSQRVDKLSNLKKTEPLSKFERLFILTKKLLSTLKSKEVLEEFIESLSDFYTHATPKLLLTHEDAQYKDLPVSYFEWDTKVKNKAAFYAYQKGTIQIEEKDGIHRLYIPLKGTQAMYGVLQLLLPDKKAMTEVDFEILKHLADVFGNAFEKAKLHEQIYKRMNDLHLLNETSQTLNSNLRLSDTVHYMTEKITSSFQAEEVGFFFYNRKGEIELLK
jgi:K+-sensing histidine kinase KdpD